MQEKSTAEQRFQILSLDGGGLKGLFTAAYLEEWEAYTGRSVTAAVDLIAGTSAGGIIALGLGAGYSANELVGFFLEHGEAIFPPDTCAWMGRLKQAVGSRYRAEPFETLLDNYFGDRKLGDSRVRLIVPAYHAESGIHLFKTSHHPRLRVDWRERMATVARATAAAPTFLPPLTLEPGLRLIDGGVWANNPVLIGITEAIGYLDCSPDRVAALRIGTTMEATPLKRYPKNPGGVGPKNLALFTEVMMRGQSQAASGGAFHLLGPGRFVEVNPMVALNDCRLDRLSRELVGLAKAEFRKSVSELGDKGFLGHQAKPFTPFHTNSEAIANER